MQISESDRRELVRLIHEDQGTRNPAFSSKFADEVLTWDKYVREGFTHNLWLKGVVPEPAPVPSAPAPSPLTDGDDMPF